METYLSAVKALLKRINEGETNNTPLSPTDVMLVSKAINELTENATLEKALVAVCEEHLTTSTDKLAETLQAVIDAQKFMSADVNNLAGYINTESVLTGKIETAKSSKNNPDYKTHEPDIVSFPNSLTITPPPGCYVEIVELKAQVSVYVQGRYKSGNYSYEDRQHHIYLTAPITFNLTSGNRKLSVESESRSRNWQIFNPHKSWGDSTIIRPLKGRVNEPVEINSATRDIRFKKGYHGGGTSDNNKPVVEYVDGRTIVDLEDFYDIDKARYIDAVNMRYNNLHCKYLIKQV